MNQAHDWKPGRRPRPRVQQRVEGAHRSREGERRDRGPTATSLTVDNGVILDRVALVVRSVELEPDTCPGATGATGSVSPMHDGGMDGDDDSCALKFGPFPVDLSGDALANGIHWQFEVPVPAGTYHEIKFKLNTINAGQAGSDAVLADMAARHASILIEGHLDANTPFTFAVPFSVEQEREGAITVDQANGAAITLDIGPTHWFDDVSGHM
jgi:hypothetical protein